MVVFGIILIALGVAFILLGLTAAAREVFRKSTAPATRGLPIDPAAWEKLLRAMTELIKVACGVSKFGARSRKMPICR